jgi:hypothetical protein
VVNRNLNDYMWGCGDFGAVGNRGESPGQIRRATCQFPVGGLKKDLLTGSSSAPVQGIRYICRHAPGSIKGGERPIATAPALVRMRRRMRARAAGRPPRRRATGTWRAAGGDPLPERADSASNRVTPKTAPSRPTTVGVHVRGGSRVSIESMQERPQAALRHADRARLPRSEFSIRFLHRQ